MKKIITLLSCVVICFSSCNKDKDDQALNVSTTFNFISNWDGQNISSSDFENTEYINQNGETITITRLRYIISNITFTKENGETIVVDGYKLIDVTNNDVMYTPETTIETGMYTNVSFTYGLKHEDNVSGIYADLNSAVFNVPLETLGGGYHYMQFDGKYSNATTTDAAFNYHNIRAVNAGIPPAFPDQPTFINVDLGPMAITANTTIDINANMAQWFKEPNTWDLNVLNQVLMPNANAQLLMNQNGQNVFSLNE